jgi:hypothetical protein
MRRLRGGLEAAMADAVERVAAAARRAGADEYFLAVKARAKAAAAAGGGGGGKDVTAAGGPGWDVAALSKDRDGRDATPRAAAGSGRDVTAFSSSFSSSFSSAFLTDQGRGGRDAAPPRPPAHAAAPSEDLPVTDHPTPPAAPAALPAPSPHPAR